MKLDYRFYMKMVEIYKLKVIDWVGGKDWERLVRKRFGKYHLDGEAVQFAALLDGNKIYINADYNSRGKAVLLLHEFGHRIFHTEEKVSGEWEQKYWHDELYHWQKEVDVARWVYRIHVQSNKFMALRLLRSVARRRWRETTPRRHVIDSITATGDLKWFSNKLELARKEPKLAQR